MWVHGGVCCLEISGDLHGSSRVCVFFGLQKKNKTQTNNRLHLFFSFFSFKGCGRKGPRHSFLTSDDDFSLKSKDKGKSCQGLISQKRIFFFLLFLFLTKGD